MEYKPFTTDYTPLIIDDMKEYLKRINNSEAKIDTLDLCHLIGEIERLNNIINELDTWLKEKVDSFKEDEYVSTNIEHERLAIKMVYHYLQELKGSDKE